jgi:RecJ-like exonuclease
MKLIIAFTLSILLFFESYSQQLDQSINEIATDLSQKVFKKNKTKLALTDFVNSEGKVDALTEYIREELELKLINADQDLQIMDRKHIKLLLSEHRLQSDGLIDEATAKSAISFIKVDGWILAEITTLGEQIKIKVTVIDITTSQIYAAVASGLISDIAVKKLLEPEIKACTECGGKGTIQMQSTCPTCKGNGTYSCINCKGTGRREGMTIGSYLTCEACSGVGKFYCKLCSESGKIITYKTCPKCNGIVPKKSTANSTQASAKVEICNGCNGKGKLRIESTCPTCNGYGWAPIGPLVGYERKPCQTCSGTKKVSSFIVCSKCKGVGKL